MARVLLIHWNASEAAERAGRLRDAGFDAYSFSGPGGAAFRALAEQPPDAIVIDLSRLPSHGSAVGIAFRQRKSTRLLPLVFLEGDPEKTARIRDLLPDATYTSWPKISAALRRALKTPAKAALVPDTFAGYTGTPLHRKLRIVENCAVALMHAPRGFATKLTPEPAGVRYVKSPADAGVILAFMTRSATLRREMPSLASIMRKGRTLWVVWPKKTSPLAGDLSEPAVRAAGLAAGLVDYKVCAVDADWSGLAFSVRSAKAAS